METDFLTGFSDDIEAYHEQRQDVTTATLKKFSPSPLIAKTNKKAKTCDSQPSPITTLSEFSPTESNTSKETVDDEDDEVPQGDLVFSQLVDDSSCCLIVFCRLPHPIG